VYCDHCGQPLALGTRVCPHCGRVLVDVDNAVVTLDRHALVPVPVDGHAPVAPQLTPPAPAPFWDPVHPSAGDRSPGTLLARHPNAGMVPRGPGSRVLLAALRRNPLGSLVGAVAAWFNVPFIVLMAAVGAIAGGLVGVVSGTVAGTGVISRIDALFKWVFPLPVSTKDLLPTAGAQIGGIVGGLLGALHGAWRLGVMAAVWPWETLYRGDATWPAAVVVGNVLTALFVGGLFLVWTWYAEPWRLRVAGARRMSRREAEWLLPIVLEVAERLRLDALPAILVDDRREPNADAGVRHLVITYGLLEQLAYDRDQVAAVLAHELAHWRDGDAFTAAWGKGVALPLYLVYELVDRLLRVARSRPLHFIVRTLFWSVIVTVRYLVVPVQAHHWRAAEYAADAGAAVAGYDRGLRGALSYLRNSFDGSQSGWDRTLLATHPPNELRLERLERTGRRYPLREDHPLVRALPGWTSESTVRKGW
jgi:Zn-dependent protease with chaperone function